MACSYTLAVKADRNVKVSTCLSFDPNSDGSVPWNELKVNGEFTRPKKDDTNQIFGEMGCGVAAKTTIPENCTKEIEMVLVWDMPNVCFAGKQKVYSRFYTNYFGIESAGNKIAAYALETYKTWEDSIHNWQESILGNK